MGELNSTGYSVQTFAEIKIALENVFRLAFGEDVNLDEQSPQGSIINQLAEWLENQDAVGLDVYNGLNLNTAEGLMLDFIAILRGTERIDGTQAVIDVTLTSSSYPYTISAGTEFKVLNTDYIFTNASNISVTSASQSVELTASENGETGVIVTDKLQSLTYIAELTDITVTDITDGTDNEADSALRTRLKAINSLSSTNDIDSIYAGLYALTNVQKVAVFENDTDTTDANNIPAHSINAVVLGDTDQNIADVIFLKKPAGTGTTGSTSATSTDSQGYGHIIYFDRPSKLNVYISCTATAKDGSLAVDGSYDDTIRDECESYVDELKIGQDVSYSTIYGIFAKYNAFDISALEMSTTSPTSGFSTGNIEVPLRSYTTIETPATDISITVVI